MHFLKVCTKGVIFSCRIVARESSDLDIEFRLFELAIFVQLTLRDFVIQVFGEFLDGVISVNTLLTDLIQFVR